MRLLYKGESLAATVVDSGTADCGSPSRRLGHHQGATTIDLPPLTLDMSYTYAFADPIFRLGNDYSKGIILSTGYIGQRTADGLVTSLTDGHPGVSGGGVLNQEGNLVGIPIGRMEADYRFSFILPLRAEMFRKVPCSLSRRGNGGGSRRLAARNPPIHQSAESANTCEAPHSLLFQVRVPVQPFFEERQQPA